MERDRERRTERDIDKDSVRQTITQGEYARGKVRDRDSEKQTERDTE